MIAVAYAALVVLPILSFIAGILAHSLWVDFNLPSED